MKMIYSEKVLPYKRNCPSIPFIEETAVRKRRYLPPKTAKNTAKLIQGETYSEKGEWGLE